jgi:cyclopropane-fatty-acyl-phospholipid synthase
MTMQDETAFPRGGRSPLAPARLLRDRVLLRLCAAATRNVDRGRLRLTLPSGASMVIGRGGTTEAHLVLNNFAVFSKGIRRGTIGFAEAYMNGDIDSPAIGDVLRFFVDNKAGLNQSGRGFFRVRRPDMHFHRRRANNRVGAKQNIAAHYDLGNDFYAAWLDPGMTYSSARFGAPEMDLQAAQAEKYRLILAGLDLQPGHSLLEIGCGWGGFAEAAARAGSKVTGITISAEQLAYAQRRLADAGLADRCDLRFEDYRDTTGTFDRIASIEMIEAVGEEHWPSYFATVAARLKPGGVAMIQAITIAPASFESYRAKADFIQRYIFPGGMLPTEAIMAAQAEKAGLTFEAVDRFGADYAHTLRTWRRSFEQAWPKIARLGFDERFRRMWLYYYIYCEVGFDRGVTTVGHYRLVKPATIRAGSKA